MKSLIFLIFAILLTVSGSYARGPGRAPAVEDFVGIESEAPDVTPAGTQALFNFESEVKSYQGRPQTTQAVIVHATSTPVSTSSTSWPLAAWIGIAGVLALPVVTWLMTMRHLKTVEPVVTATTVVPDNVTPLRPKTTAETEAEKYKKAS